MSVTVQQLRAFALSRSLDCGSDLASVIRSLGFVQADPIRAPARAQDLILMQRLPGYRAGDLERHYPSLDIEEDMLQNYGFVPRDVQVLVHPREIGTLKIESAAPGLSARVLDFVRERGAVHPRDLDEHFGRVQVGNYWGGTSNAATRVLDGLHYRGELRVVRRDKGVRVYEAAHHLHALRERPLPREEQARGLLGLLLRQLAPVSTTSLGYVVSLLGYGAPHLKTELRAALKGLEASRATVDGVTYLWPVGELPDGASSRRVRLLAPFDPLVWDRRRFAHLHGWSYKFEAYVPAPKRVLGYYALPLLWEDQAIGWANLRVVKPGKGPAELRHDVGFVAGQPKSKAFQRALNSELDRYRAFLGLDDEGSLSAAPA
ncbi:DNA glycosylase AlkZ-like family protein [Deinococcus peraridilitoris]|uniref:Winged helix-turn-helix domain-containing protein n=1 Tax=Deinococcus peraridilitoris (strain DSM 19664 / LMG 22246 / CIP 109416 / KR-200) TaxID=937777 RepID=L0A5Q3_DEIPD|nr:crosslink repair DNA glycosylase YcaQ family protein [Deinococcus peraridilitoris]AFZ68350.1 hypothetical protein Deipe_2889 [Deinococcus peraridilitoris DSM 19664]